MIRVVGIALKVESKMVDFSLKPLIFMWLVYKRQKQVMDLVSKYEEPVEVVTESVMSFLQGFNNNFAILDDFLHGVEEMCFHLLPIVIVPRLELSPSLIFDHFPTKKLKNSIICPL